MSPRRWAGSCIGLAVAGPVLAGVVASFASTTDLAGQVAILATLLAAGLYGCAAAVLLVTAVIAGLSGRWGVSFRRAVFPIAVIAVLMPPVRQDLARLGDLAHLALHQQQYRQAIAADPADAGRKLLWFFWTDQSSLFTFDAVYLVYDDSDEIAQPGDLRTAQWRERARATTPPAQLAAADGIPIDAARHLIGHFYVVTLGF